MFARLSLAALGVVLLSGCNPAQVQWFADASRDDRDAVIVHVLTEAADEFGADPALLIRISRCESGLRPEAINRTSHASGLGQHLPSYWPGRAAAIGLPEDTSPFDPVANARVSAWMLANQGTAPWAESRGCWAR